MIRKSMFETRFHYAITMRHALSIFTTLVGKIQGKKTLLSAFQTEINDDGLNDIEGIRKLLAN